MITKLFGQCTVCMHWWEVKDDRCGLCGSPVIRWSMRYIVSPMPPVQKDEIEKSEAAKEQYARIGKALVYFNLTSPIKIDVEALLTYYENHKESSNE